MLLLRSIRIQKIFEGKVLDTWFHVGWWGFKTRCSRIPLTPWYVVFPEGVIEDPCGERLMCSIIYRQCFAADINRCSFRYWPVVNISWRGSGAIRQVYELGRMLRLPLYFPPQKFGRRENAFFSVGFSRLFCAKLDQCRWLSWLWPYWPSFRYHVVDLGGNVL